MRIPKASNTQSAQLETNFLAVSAKPRVSGGHSGRPNGVDCLSDESWHFACETLAVVLRGGWENEALPLKDSSRDGRAKLGDSEVGANACVRPASKVTDRAQRRLQLPPMFFS